MKPPMMLYIHIPFCARKCLYCDFLSGYGSEEEKESYVRSLLQEISLVKEPVGRYISSVYIGRGTPTVIPAKALASVLASVRERFVLTPDCEVSLEVNPGTVSEKELFLLREAGVNRLSIGLQSPREQELRVLGRIHGWEDFLRVYGEARDAGFSDLNVDLMYALPGQTPEKWRQNLETVAALQPEHISAYSLIIEEGTPFSRMQLSLPGEEEEYTMMEETQDVLSARGYLRYEISNYAKPGYECRHNLGYWERKEYLGLGLGAASYIGHRRFSNVRDLKTYLGRKGRPSEIRENIRTLDLQDEMAEFMFLGLRKTEGIREEDFFGCFHRSIWEVYEKPLTRYLDLGLMYHRDGRLFLSRHGLQVSNVIMADFV